MAIGTVVGWFYVIIGAMLMALAPFLKVRLQRVLIFLSFSAVMLFIGLAILL